MDKDYSKMTVPQLKAECVERGLPTTPAKKSDLLSRIMQDVVSQAKQVEDDEEEAENEKAMLEGEDNNAPEPDDAILEEGKTETEEQGEKTAETNGEAKNGEVKDELTEGAETEKKVEKKPEATMKLPKPPGMTTNIDRKKIGLPDGVPDVPNYHAIQEARISETRVRTVVIFPLDIADMANTELHEVLATTQHFMLKYVLNKDQVMKGFVEMHFNTRALASSAAQTLADLTFSNQHTVRQLAASEAGTAYKTAVIDEISPHLSHQIKKSSDDYDTRIVYVHNMPADMDEAKVRETFPEARGIMTALDEDGKNKGYAYLNFETEEETADCVKKHSKVTVGETTVCVFQIKDLKAAAGIDTKRPFHRRGGVNRSPMNPNMRGGGGGAGKPRGGPQNMGRGGGRPPMPPHRGGYNNMRGGMDRGGMRGGRGGRGGGVPPLMGMQGYDRPQMSGGRPPRFMPGQDQGYGMGYGMEYQDRKRGAMQAGFMDMGDGQPWKMSRNNAGYGGPGGRYGGGGNWGGNRW